MQTKELIIGDINAKFLDPDAQKTQARLLEDRMTGYRIKVDSRNISYDSGDFIPTMDFITHAIQLPGKLDELTMWGATYAVMDISKSLTELHEESPNSFELIHIIAQNRLAYADRLVKETSDTGDEQYLNKAGHIYETADSHFNLALMSVQETDPKFQGYHARIFAESIEAKRKRLDSILDVDKPKLMENQISEILNRYEQLFQNLTFSTEEEAAKNIARYLEMVAYTIKESQDFSKYYELAKELALKFPDVPAVKSTRNFYKTALGI